MYATPPDFPDAESQKTREFYLLTSTLSLLHVQAHTSEKNFNGSLIFCKTFQLILQLQYTKRTLDNELCPSRYL